MAPACLKVWLGKQTHEKATAKDQCWEVGGAGARGADGWGPRLWGSGQESLGWMFQLSLQDDPLEEGMATHSSILAWRIPWTEEPGGLQSMGSQRDTTEAT